MPYYYPKNQNTGQDNYSPDFGQIPRQLWDILRSGAAGFKQGFMGKDLTFEQWQRERKRQKAGLPSQYPDRNWLQRLIRGKR